ncbi:ATP-binding Cassette (ABC) Superfamily, partial [Thraustotheca clavata]
ESLLAIPNGLYKSLVEAQLQKQVESDEVPVVATKRQVSNVSSKGGVDAVVDGNESTTSGSESSEEAVVPISRVWKLSKPETWNLVLGSLGSVLSGGVFPLWGVLLTKCTVLFFEINLTSDEMRHKASMWAWAFFGLGIVLSSAMTLQHYQFAIVSERLTTRVRSLCFEAMMRQDISWFDDDKHSSGALTTQLATDSAAIRTMTGEMLNVVLVNLVSIAVAFAIAFSQSWQMTLVLIGIFPVIAIAGQIQMQTMTLTTTANDGDIQAGALLSEAINSIRTLMSFCLENKTTDAYLVALNLSGNVDKKAGLLSGLGFGISQSSVFFAMSFLFWFGGWLMLRGDITFEQMFLVLNPIMVASMTVGMAANGLGDVSKAKKAVQSIFGIIDRVPHIDCTSNDGLQLDDVRGSIRLENVTFAYPSRPGSKIYNNYSLSIHAGQTLALVGGSGSGKSTAINLIERFYDPAAGAVY